MKKENGSSYINQKIKIEILYIEIYQYEEETLL